jgi:glycosyltransferase involved in cell wall biosynthesis
LDDPVFLQWELNTKFLIARSKLVIAGSGYLRDYSRTWNHHVILIPSPVPLERFDPYQNTSLSHPNSPTIVGWIGSESTLSHIEILIDVFDVLRERYPLHVKVIGTGDAPCPISRKDNLEVTTIPYYDEEEMIRQVFSFNIGVVPLRQSEATRGKTGLKALIYMAAGIPVVCSPVGENLEFVTDGVTGYCASTPDDWVEKLDRLVRDASLRRRMGEEGLALVRERYTTEICFEFLYRALCSTVLGDQEALS